MTLAVEQEEDGRVTRERLQTDGAGCFLVDILSVSPLWRPHLLLRELAVERRSWGQQPRLREGRGSPHRLCDPA